MAAIISDLLGLSFGVFLGLKSSLFELRSFLTSFMDHLDFSHFFEVFLRSESYDYLLAAAVRALKGLCFGVFVGFELETLFEL